VKHTIITPSLLALLAGSAGAQDFHFISSRDSGAGELNYEIYRYQNGNQVRVTHTPVIEATPTFSPGNNAVYGRGLDPTGVPEIIVLDPQFGQPFPLTQDGAQDGRRGNTLPFLAPDEASLFVTTLIQDGTSVIRRLDLGGNELGIVVDDQAAVGHSPTAATPHGPKLYYSSDVDGDFELYRCDLDGNNKQQLTSNAVYDAGATPSADGTKIAFTRTDPLDTCSTQLFVMDHDGSNPVMITDPFVQGIKWPFGWDGNNVLYCSNEGGDMAIYMIGADGLGQQLLIDSPGMDMVFLPDPLSGMPLPEPQLLLPPVLEPQLPVQLVLDLQGHDYVQFEWTFGDGNTAITNVPDVQHVFVNPNLYMVTCTATDSCNNPFVLDTFLPVFPPLWPGTNDDLLLLVGVNGPPVGIDFQIALPGDDLNLFIESPNGTHDGNFPFIGVQVYPHDLTQELFPGLYLGFGPGFLLPGDPLNLGPLQPGGSHLPLPIPPDPGLAGIDLMWQGMVLSPNTQNGFFGTSDGKVIRLP